MVATIKTDDINYLSPDEARAIIGNGYKSRIFIGEEVIIISTNLEI